MMNELISEYLFNQLNYAYCDNCNNSNNVEDCDDCHRKQQNWCLAKHTADKLAANIIDMINKED